MTDLVLLPKVPTEDMSKAFWSPQLPGEADMFEWFKAGYAAMLLAAPETDEEKVT